MNSHLKNKNKDRAPEIFQRLTATFPDAHCELWYETPFQLLIATILSAQCTDVQVNKITPTLFAQYPTPEKLMNAPVEEVERIIHSTGFYRNKAKNIIGCARSLVENFHGRIPKTIEELTTLPGVGRKTANCLLSNAFHIHSGVVVDTHVGRISQLLKLTRHSDPLKIEQDLMKLFPREQWGLLSHLLIFLGRRICPARRPQCAQCPLSDLCPSSTAL